MKQEIAISSQEALPAQSSVAVIDQEGISALSIEATQVAPANEEFFVPTPEEAKNLPVVSEQRAVIDQNKEAANDEVFALSGSVERKRDLRIGLIDATSLMESRARDIAGDRLASEKGELSGVKGVMKKIWKYNLAAEYYRQKEIAKVKAEITKSGTNFIDSNDGDTEKKAHYDAMSAITERFLLEGEDAIHKGETKKEMPSEEQQESQTALKQLVLRYGRGEIADKGAFQEEKQKVLKTLHGDSADAVKFADNLFEVAEQVKAAVDQGESVEALEKELRIITGEARGGVRTTENKTRVDRIIDKLNSTKLGTLVNADTLALAVGAAWSVGAFVGMRLTSSKIAAIASFGGTAALGAGAAALRERTHLQYDRAQHVRDRAQGKEIDNEHGEHREEMETVAYEMKSSQDLIAGMQGALFEAQTDGTLALKKNLTQKDIEQSLTALAETEERIHFSDTQNIDLIKYASAASLERERLNIDIARAKTKVELQKILAAQPELLASQEGETPDTKASLESQLSLHTAKAREALTQEVTKKDELFAAMKRKGMARAALTTFATGVLLGGVTQEVAAFGTHQQGLVEGWVSGQKPDSSSETFAKYLFGGQHLSESLPHHSVTAQEFMSHQQGGVEVKRLDWMDNDTPSHFDKNELKLAWGGEHGTGINKEGNFVFDVKHMVRGGSTHGNLSADALALAKEGKLEMIFSASKETQGQVLKFPIDGNGTVIINPKDPAFARFFSSENGHAVFKGKFAEVAEIVQSANKEHPVESVRVLATHIGQNNVDFGTIVGATKADVLPIIPMMPLTTHTPLEKMKPSVASSEALPENPAAPSGEDRRAPLEKLPLLHDTEILKASDAKEITIQGEQNPERASAAETSSQEQERQEEKRADQKEKPKATFQKRSTENQSQDFFVKRKKYETDEQYYARFQKFATQTLGLAEDASYDEIKKHGRVWRQKNAERTGAQDTFTFLKMTKSLDELKRYQRAQQEKEAEKNLNQEQSERQEKIQIKAKALSKLWEKIIATEIEKNQEKNNENAYDIFQRVLDKQFNVYEKEERVLLVDALKAEGIVLVLKNDSALFGEARWVLDVDAMEKLREVA